MHINSFVASTAGLRIMNQDCSCRPNPTHPIKCWLSSCLQGSHGSGQHFVTAGFSCHGRAHQHQAMAY